jgi:hypothetical protein
MAFGNILKKKLSEGSGDGAKISEMTGANTFGDVVKIISGQRPIGGTLAKSIPMAVDVSAEGMRKKSKTLTKGTGVSYSGIKTSSQGLLAGANVEKKTLLGG